MCVVCAPLVGVLCAATKCQHAHEWCFFRGDFFLLLAPGVGNTVHGLAASDTIGCPRSISHAAAAGVTSLRGITQASGSVRADTHAVDPHDVPSGSASVLDGMTTSPACATTHAGWILHGYACILVAQKGHYGEKTAHAHGENFVCCRFFDALLCLLARGCGNSWVRKYCMRSAVTRCQRVCQDCVKCKDNNLLQSK